MTEKLSREFLKMHSFSEVQINQQQRGQLNQRLSSELQIGSPRLIMNEIIESNNDFDLNDSGFSMQKN